MELSRYLGPELSQLLDSLPDPEWDLFWAFQRRLSLSLRVLKLHEWSSLDVDKFINLSPRAIAFIGKRFSPASQSRLVTATLSSYNGNDLAVLQFAAEALEMTARQPSDWDAVLKVLENLRCKGGIPRHLTHRRADMPPNAAKHVGANPSQFPIPTVAEADEVLQSRGGSEAESLAGIAKRDHWFERG